MSVCAPLERQGALFDPPLWRAIKDGDDDARRLFNRHYSRRAHDPRGLFVGPGERLVLTTPCRRALFVWRREMFKQDGQTGVNCSIFRNEGAGLSSWLIEQADVIADTRWPGVRHYTYVDPRSINSTNPGYCFIQAGWRRCGITKTRKLVILERSAA